MTLFTIETSTNVCSAAWCIDHECVALRVLNDGKSNHAAILPQFIQELLIEAQRNNWVADAVAVSIGPGSYTGLRIGLSTAKGLCYGWHIPMIAVPTLDILTQVARQSYPDFTGTFLPMLDARRMEVYTALYPSAPSTESPTPMAKVIDSADWLPKDTDVYYFGDGAGKCQSVIESPHCHFVDDIVPMASAIGVTVSQHNYPLISEKELAYYTPFYLKEFIAAPSHIKGLK